jgi:hypothetical protein
MKKTIKQWLQELPDGIRERALANCDAPDAVHDSMHNALISAFRWSGSEEGYTFWHEAANAIARQAPIKSHTLESQIQVLTKAMQLWPQYETPKFQIDKVGAWTIDYEGGFYANESPEKVLLDCAIDCQKADIQNGFPYRWAEVVDYLEQNVNKR